jgi:hypothetical protein
VRVDENFKHIIEPENTELIELGKLLIAMQPVEGGPFTRRTDNQWAQALDLFQKIVPMVLPPLPALVLPAPVFSRPSPYSDLLQGL